MVEEVATVVFHCRRCHSTVQADLRICWDEDGFVIPGGTLDSDTALRWTRSHAEPVAYVE